MSDLTPSVQTLGVGGGASHGKPLGDLRNATFSRRDLLEKRLICICYVNKTFGDVDLTFKIEFIRSKT